MEKNRITILATVFAVFVLVSALASIPVQAQTETEITVNAYGFTRFENFFGEPTNISFCAIISLPNVEDLDYITVTDPNDVVILNTSEPDQRNDEVEFCADFGTSTPPFGNYTITVTNKDGTSQSVSVLTTESSLSSTTPIIKSPVETNIVTDSTPVLSWEAFQSPEKGPDETLSYLLEMFHPTLALPGDDVIWRAGVPGDVLSATYNFDGSALFEVEELIPAEYTFLLFAFEFRGNHRRTSIRSSHFTFDWPAGTEVFLPVILRNYQ